MKFVISFLLSLSVQAAPIQVFYEEDSVNARAVKDIFMGQYHIPEDLIDLKGIRNCDELKGGGKLDLCLKNNGDLVVVSVDKNFVSESLQIFQAP